MSTVYTKKLDEWGWQIEVTFLDSDGQAIDISLATEKKILWKTPAKTVISKNAFFSTDGTDGKISYTTAESDFDTIGAYAVEAMVVLATGKILSIESFRINVNQSLAAQAS